MRMLSSPATLERTAERLFDRTTVYTRHDSGNHILITETCEGTVIEHISPARMMMMSTVAILGNHCKIHNGGIA